MNRSQRILIAIGLGALAAMAAPYVLRAIVDDRAVAEKVLIFNDVSSRPAKDLVLCLIKHPGALNLTVASNDLYVDPASGLAVKVDDAPQARQVRAWLPKGKALTGDQQAQLSGCLRES